MESLIQHARTITPHPSTSPHPRTGTSTAAPQRPEALFIACSDARVSPAFLTGARPGQLFELRNVGNVVPPHRPGRPTGEAATIEYAVGVLGVTDIVVCGHSDCGAVRTLRPGGLSISAFTTWWWLTRTNQRSRQTAAAAPADPGQLHLLAQLEKLRRYPKVARGLAHGRLRVHGWFYNLSDGRILAATTEDSTSAASFAPL
ncbi:MAG TPA: carbonic anhydrase [Spirillospora sp.]|nr:carbonic anhydrase [Spirillospora sp.]